jgi:hypothetical protein
VNETGSGMCPVLAVLGFRTLISGNWLVSELLCNNKQAFGTGIKFHLFVGLFPAWLFIQFLAVVLRKHTNKSFRN